MTADHTLHGTRIGHYRLGEVVGVGSYATAYHAVDERLHATVVVKVLAENHSLNPEIRERFLAEGRSLRRVTGSHVVTVYDIGESPRQQPYLVLEYADRGSVQERVAELWRRGWRASPADVLAFARPLATAVDAVHRAHLVHRDLSPGNLLLASIPPPVNAGASEAVGDGAPASGRPVTGSALLADDERLLVADLGLCKDLAVHSGLTVAGGTSGFRPPEQDGPSVVDIRADIWAMSALIRWLSWEADLPSDLAEVLRRGLADEPGQRQPDASTWLAELEAALAPAPAPPPSAPPPGTAAPSVGRHGDQEGANPDHHDSQEPAAAGSGAAETSRRPTGRAGTPQRPKRRFRLFIIALLIGVLLGAAAAVQIGNWLRAEPEEAPSSVPGASVAIDGPEQVAVGEVVEFTAETTGVQSWTWVLPTGRYVLDEEQVRLTPTVPGTAEVVLRAIAPDGTELEVRHRIRVVD